MSRILWFTVYTAKWRRHYVECNVL